MYLGMIGTAQNIVDDLCNDNQLQHARTFQGNYPNVRWPVHPKNCKIFWRRRIICLRLLDLPLGERSHHSTGKEQVPSILLCQYFSFMINSPRTQNEPCKNNRAILHYRYLRSYVNTSVLLSKHKLHTFLTPRVYVYSKISKTFCSCLLRLSDIRYSNEQDARSQTLPFKHTASFRQNDFANKRGVGAHSSFFFWFDFSRLRRVIYGNNPLIMRFKPKARSWRWHIKKSLQDSRVPNSANKWRTLKFTRSCFLKKMKEPAS